MKSFTSEGHYISGTFNPGVLTPGSQLFHDPHSKFMKTGLLLNILEDTETTHSVTGVKNIDAKSVKLTQTKVPTQGFAPNFLCLPNESKILNR